MKNFYYAIENRNKTHRCISALVLDGTDSGKRLLWSDHGILYRDETYPVWDILIAEYFSDLNGSQIITIENTRIFCEVLGSRPNLIICGAGHISMPLISMGKMLGFHVTTIDDRPMFANNARRARADQVICDGFSQALETISNDQNNYFIIVTRGHRHDISCLEKIIDKPHAYIGMIGSKRRIASVVDTLVEQGIERSRLDEVHMPIGLRIKAQTPEEIAISIMAEIILEKNSKNTSYSYSEEMLKALTSPPGVPGKAMTTIISRRGSAPRGTGTKMLVLEDGTAIGTIGGGCAEASVLQEALQCIKHGQNTIVHVDMTGQQVEDEGMVCGGVIDVFIESI